MRTCNLALSRETYALDPDQTAGLIPTHIATRTCGRKPAFSKVQGGQRAKKTDLPDQGFVRDLHCQMFDNTWRWAGAFRSSNKNIDVRCPLRVCLRDLLDNTRYQIENQPSAWMHWMRVFATIGFMFSPIEMVAMRGSWPMRLGRTYFPWLCVAAGQQNHPCHAALREVRSATRPVMNPHCRHGYTDGA